MIPNTPAHKRAWAAAEARFETELAAARPPAASHQRRTDYPTATRAALAAWDEEMGNR